MEVHTYSDDDILSTSYRNGEQPWEFIADIPGDNSDLLGDFDNNMMVDHLKECGAVQDCDVVDPEVCCFYIYFKDKNAGRRFIKGLNNYLLMKAQLFEKARSF